MAYKSIQGFSLFQCFLAAIVCLLTLLMLLPIVALFFTAVEQADSDWLRLAKASVPRYLGTTVRLIVLVVLGCFFWGAGSAWFVSSCQFLGRKTFLWALALPMAVPSYIIAFIYTDAFEFAGYMQKGLRQFFGWQRGDYYFPEIRSVAGAAFVLTMVFYPYVYLVARSAFLQRIAGYIEAARALGKRPLAVFFRVALPLARPFLAIGLVLVAFETLNAYGSLELMGVQSLSVGIYNTWVIFGSQVGAARIALLGIGFVFILLAIERRSRSAEQRFSNTSQPSINVKALYPLHGFKAFGAWLFCFFPILAGALFPLGVLTYYTLFYWHKSFTSHIWRYAANSFLLGALGAGITLLVTLCIFFALGRQRRGGPLQRFSRLATFGYAFPGVLIAVGTMQFLAWSPVLLIGTYISLLFALSLRFQMLSYGMLESGLSKISPQLDEAARVLGKKDAVVFGSIHLPLLHHSILAAALLVCIEIMKELPITLILRPFGLETLATFVFQYAGDERYAESALGALLLVLVSLIPVYSLSQYMEKSSKRSSHGL